MNVIQKKVGVAILISHRLQSKDYYQRQGEMLHMDEKVNSLGRHSDPKGACTFRAAKYMKQNLIELKISSQLQPDISVPLFQYLMEQVDKKSIGGYKDLNNDVNNLT